MMKIVLRRTYLIPMAYFLQHSSLFTSFGRERGDLKDTASLCISFIVFVKSQMVLLPRTLPGQSCQQSWDSMKRLSACSV